MGMAGHLSWVQGVVGQPQGLKKSNQIKFKKKKKTWLGVASHPSEPKGGWSRVAKSFPRAMGWPKPPLSSIEWPSILFGFVIHPSFLKEFDFNFLLFLTFFSFKKLINILLYI